MNNEIIEMGEIHRPSAPPMVPQNEIIRNKWSDGSTSLLAKWERICAHRKKAHYSASNDYGWKNKFLSIPIIVISTILGSLSFIHPSFVDKVTCSRRLSLNGYVPDLYNGPADCCTHSAPWDDPFTLMCQTCAYDVLGEDQTGITYKWYDDDAIQFQLTCSANSESSVFCSGQNNQNGGSPWYTANCEETCLLTPTFNPTTATPTTANPTIAPTFFPTPTACANNCCISGPDMWRSDASPTIPGWTVESPYLDHTNGGLWKKNQCEDMCRTDSQCNSWMWRNSASSCYLSTYTELKEYRPNPGYNDHHPHKFSRGCTNTPTFSPTKTPTKTPTTVAPSSPAERCENYCQNSCAQFGTPEDNVSECQGCDSSKACYPGASNYNSLEAWCAFYACDSVNSRCDNWRCAQPSNTPTTTKTPTTTPTTSPSPPFEGKSGDGEEENSENCEIGNCHIVEESNDCAVDEKMVAICNSDGSWGDSCILNNNIHESCFEETPTTSPTPPFEGKSGKSGDSEGDGDGEECAPGCHDDWPGDGVCDDSCFNSACNYDDGDCPTASPTKLPTTSSPTQQPSREPTRQPSREPTQQPTQPISYMQGGASARSTESNDEGNTIIFPYIIGAFNMMIAILSALHTFLKYDALEDRHHQYSRHFANLQVDLETLLAKPHDQRGDVGTMVERYKTKYAVLINNAPDLSEKLERRCCGSEQIIPTTCETPRKISGYSFSD